MDRLLDWGVSSLFFAVLGLLIALLILSACGSGPHIERAFTSEAISHEIVGQKDRIHFSNGLFMDTYWKGYDWLHFETCMKDRCFEIITHQAIVKSGPSQFQMLEHIEEVDCRYSSDEVDRKNSWEENEVDCD